MNNRDDFSAKVKQAVATRAGWHCSICQKLTVGPSEEAPDAVTKIGKASHIAAAASGPGARRYDASMTPKDRASIGNAIWLCSDHAELIDRDAITYPVAWLHAVKHEHEQSIARAVRTGTRLDLARGLLAIGPNVVCTGELTSVSTEKWTFRLAHFVIGDIHKVVSLISDFTKMNLEDRYILSNDLGDGRMLIVAPTLTKEGDAYSLHCPIAPGFPRINAQELGIDLAVDPDTNDLYVNKTGDLARVSGLDHLPQKVRLILSLNKGDSALSPKFGMRFFEYFEAFRGSPWLDLLLKLDVIRQASIPFQDKFQDRRCTPLQCVTRVRSIELLAESPINNMLPVRIALDVQGVGEWMRELPIFMPTAEQVLARAKLLAEMPWRGDASLLPNA